MNDLEERVRRGLRTDVSGVGAERLLHDVHRGTARRRRRRAAAIVAASVLAIAGAVGLVTQLGSQEDAVRPPTTQLPTPTPTLPAGATQGVIDVSVVSPDRWFRLTTNVGCVGCSTVWQNDQSAEGGWERLHDFGRDAYVGKVDPMFGPVTDVVMAVNGIDGWAWGQRLFSTHDGGRTWDPVTTGPGRQNNEYGHQVGVTDQYAWSLLRTDQATELWRSPLGADDWSRADAPNMGGVSGMFTTSSHVGLETSDEGLSSPRVQYSTDGATWSELANPCGGENQTYRGESAVFILCAEGDNGATVYRSLDLAHWKVFAHSTGAVIAVYGLDDDTLLIIGKSGKGSLLTSGGTRPVDLGLAPGEETFGSDAPWSGDLVMLTTSKRLIGSSDRGVTWHPVE
jgi:hypothetical protein